MSDTLQKIKLAKLITYAVLLLLAIIAVYVILVIIPNNAIKESTQLAGKISNKLGALFNTTPVLNVQAEYISIETKDIAEFATVERIVVAEYSYTHQWLKSRKSIKLKGKYKVKGGFNLRNGFAVEILLSETPIKVKAKLPEPEILSIEQMDISVQEDNGIWNKINDSDRNFALNNLKNVAYAQLLRSDFLEEVQKTSQQRVTDVILNQLEKPSEIEFRKD